MSGLLVNTYRRMARRIVPGLRHPQHDYSEVLADCLEESARWLDLGCGHQFTPEWAWKPRNAALAARVPTVAGLDGDFESLRRHPDLRHKVCGTLEGLPFRAGSFDLVTANMVVEHLRDPLAALAEIRRVLSPGGRFVFHTPNWVNPVIRLASFVPQRIKDPLSSRLEGRDAADIYPAYYRANTPRRIEAQVRAAGFEVEKIRMAQTGAVTAVLGPLGIFELLMVRALTGPRFANYRSNIIAVLRRSAGR
jgi:SAM-dependent methyltransferase